MVGLNNRGTPIPLLVIAALILGTGPVWAQKFVSIDVPGSVSTVPQTINDLGEIVGLYVDESAVRHGFLLSSGAFTTIDFGGAISTELTGMNNNGQIVGFYRDVNKRVHGFLLSNGKFSAIDDPAFPGGTVPTQISDVGLIAGYGIDSEGVVHGFVFTNNRFTTIDFPRASLTQPLDVNYNGSEIVGTYALPSFPANSFDGFTYLNGVFTSVAFPESASTQLNGVNNVGLAVGTYSFPDASNFHSFLLNGNTFTTADYPGAVSTGASDINDLGQVVGAWIDDENRTHGYLETNGPFAYAPVRSTNSVAVFDIWTGLPLPSISVGAGPVGIGLSPRGGLAYVANYEGNSVSVINTTTNSVVATIPVGNNPLGLAVTPNGAATYVANNFSNTVSVINTKSNNVVANIPVGSIPTFIAITPNGKFAYVTNQGSGTVSVINTATNTITATVATGSDPVGLAIAPNGQFVYVVLPLGESVAVINTTTNTVAATIPVDGQPIRVSITPDGSTAYVSIQSSHVVQILNLDTNTFIGSVTVGTTPYGLASTPDGSFEWVVDLGSNQMSIISTATNTVVSTFPFTGGSDLAIAAAAPENLQITQPLSPTQPNTFNFLTNNFVVQYPPGSNFSNVNMTVAQVQISQAQYAGRVSGGQFASSTCIVYGGAGGNCVDYQVTCSETSSGNSIPCPSESQPTIGVQTSFATNQSITNPGFLTTPIGENQWQNIFTGFTDPTVKGKTKGFSEFVAVDLGTTNTQGPGRLTFLAPLRTTDPRVFGSGVQIPVKFQLASILHAGQPVTDALASLTVVWEIDATGHSQNKLVLTASNAFHYQSGTGYTYQLSTTGFAPGTYLLTVYGNAFAAQHVQFSVVRRINTTCVLNSTSSFFTNGQPLTFTLLVQASSPSSNSPTGQATFIDTAYSQYQLGTAPVARGTASIQAALEAPPNRQWTKAAYSGDNNFAPCTSGYIAEDYNPPPK